MKTVEEYLNDPRIINDQAMIGALEPIRKIHAIRLKIQDETEGMTTAERAALFKENSNAFFSSLGLPLPSYVNLSGQGKLKSKVPFN